MQSPLAPIDRDYVPSPAKLASYTVSGSTVNLTGNTLTVPSPIGPSLRLQGCGGADVVRSATA